MKKAFSFITIVLLITLAACQASVQTPSPTPQTASVTLQPVPPSTSTPAPTATQTETPPIEVTVNTDQDIVDGDTTQINALLSNPGADGMISLREAVMACNLTPGPKKIVFSPSLKDATLFLGKAQRYEEPRFLLTMDQLTVDGDVDGDGVSDITLDGSALNPNYSSAFILSASHLTLANLQFNAFQRFTIAIACVSDQCASRPYEHIEIRNNTIVSDVGGGGILLSPLKIVADTADPTLFSNILLADIRILDNHIAVSNGGNGGVFIMAAGAGGSDNHLSDIHIEGNTISSPGATITVNGGDGSSYYFRLPGEERFSDRNLVEQVVIRSNHLDPVGIGGDGARPSGVVIIAGNFGNSDNVIRNVVIENNDVSANAEHAITLNPTSNGVVGGLPLTTRAATQNVIEDVEITGNISHAESGFGLLASSGEDPAPKGATGRISNVHIHHNQILDYKWEGINLFAGVGENDNLIEKINIEDNTFTSLDIAKGQALFVYAGGCSGCTRTSERNQIKALVIQNNTVNCNDFAFIYGGMEEFAIDNVVEYFMGANSLNPVDARIDAVDFVAKVNAGNRVITLDQEP